MPTSLSLLRPLRHGLIALLVASGPGLAGLAMPSVAFAEDDKPTIEELLNTTDDIQRGESSEAVMVMDVKTKRFERSMKMRALSKGTENSLVTILEPAKDAGTTTLKVGDNLWNYLPKVDRTMKIPAGMMGGSWMGSHFSNDDLVKQSRMSEDYTAELKSEPTDEAPDTNWVIELTPTPDAPVVWGKVVVTVLPEKVPLSIEYFDEKGQLQRTLSFSDVQEVDGRQVPMTMMLTPQDKEGEFTKISYEKLDFGVEISDKQFTLQALKR
jgi:outer membrane lipoprotein-sorting protein